ncbi:MAG: hypothetical protein Q4G35_01760 [Propionibacteriaceae bacterium]|nr:hypothetical protein [Propionibacteriaceae bacterium]
MSALPKAERTPGNRAFLAALIAYVLILFLGISGAVVASQIPCTGKFCELGRLFEGAMVGGLLALALTVWISLRIGMRWWFVPLIIALGVVALPAATFGGPVGWAIALLAVAAPVVSAVTAAGLPRRTMVIALAVLVGLALLGSAVIWGVKQAGDARQRSEIHDRLRAETVPLYAPAAVEGVEVKLQYPDEQVVYYEIIIPGRDGALSVSLDGSGFDRCNWETYRDMGDDIRVPGNKGDFANVCRYLDGVIADVARNGGWTGEQAVDVLRQFTPVDAEWLIERDR